ncbi:hypothetical protein [Marinicauda algicola]|nr:hypothetical protein [Marinicauda algicola]
MEFFTIGLVLLAAVLFFALRGRTRRRRSEAEEAARRAVERRLDRDDS